MSAPGPALIRAYLVEGCRGPVLILDAERARQVAVLQYGTVVDLVALQDLRDAQALIAQLEARVAALKDLVKGDPPVS